MVIIATQRMCTLNSRYMASLPGILRTIGTVIVSTQATRIIIVTIAGLIIATQSVITGIKRVLPGFDLYSL